MNQNREDSNNPNLDNYEVGEPPKLRYLLDIVSNIYNGIASAYDSVREARYAITDRIAEAHYNLTYPSNK